MPLGGIPEALGRSSTQRDSEGSDSEGSCLLLSAGQGRLQRTHTAEPEQDVPKDVLLVSTYATSSQHELI